MRKSLLLSLPLLLGCEYANARQISPGDALTYASDFMNSGALQGAQTVSKSLTPMKSPGVNVDAQSAPFYVFNRGETDGFVIISGDDRAPKILGYSDCGSFDADNVPPQLKAMMEQWAVEMSQLPVGASQHPSWKKATSTRAGEAILMETAEWGQGYPYNVYCPEIEGQQAPAGCVATAMAIAMKYHNWPDYTRGGIQENFNYQERTLDFSNYSIDWNVLNDKNNPGFGDEVGKLFFSAGVAAQMLYGSNESAAEMWPLGHKMVELYAYSKGCQYIEKKSFGQDVWENMLIEQLREVGPVIYRGSGSIGHAFVVDGFDGNDLYHVNWGWDGILNGYYTLDFSDVGGSSFAEDQGMIINIKPDKERREYSKSFVSNCDVYITSHNGSGGWSFMQSDFEPGQEIKFKTPAITLNRHVGYFDIGIVDAEDNILQILGMQHHNNDPGRHCEYPGQTLESILKFPALEEGQRFQLISMEAELAEDEGDIFAVPRSEDPKDWRIILGGMVYPSHFYDKGNPKRVCEVNFHIDDEMPVAFPNWVTDKHEFTLYKLRGGDCSENIFKPMKGVTMRITCNDKEGNIEEPLYVGSVDAGEMIGLNISMYSDVFDVYLDYNRDGNTRNDSGIAPDAILVQDGLVYKKEGEGVVLIGYDDISENVTIPEYVESDGLMHKVLSIENDALMFAPIKNLTIQTSAPFGNFAFAGITSLESLSMEGAQPEIPWKYPFMNTKIDNIYLDKGYQTNLINNFISLTWNWWGELNHAILHSEDTEVYLSELGNYNDYAFYTDFMAWGISTVLNEGWLDKVLDSYNIPGIGDPDKFSTIRDLCPLDLREMWTYTLDRENNRLMIKPQLEEVKIRDITVNGQEITPIDDFVYGVPSTDDMEVKIGFVLNDFKEMTTCYNAEYNNSLPSQSLPQSVDGIIIGKEPSGVYSLDGMLVSESSEEEVLKTLTPGIYIIRFGAEMKKLVIR